MAGEATRWKKGQSGNPEGRGRAAVKVSAMVRAETDDGRELMRLVLQVARGQVQDMKDAASRRWALEQLMDRAWGRPVQSVELSFGDDAPPKRHNFEAATIEELELLARVSEILARIDARATDEGKAPRALPALASVRLRNPDDNPNDKDGNAAT